MPNGPDKITGLPFDTAPFKSEKSITDQEILVCLMILTNFNLLRLNYDLNSMESLNFQKLLKTSANSKSSKKKKKAAAEKDISDESPPKLVEQ